MSARQCSALVLALCCVLLGPGLAAAAAPNQLHDGSVSPGSGTTQTIFSFSVAYSSERGFEASSVVALVAGSAVPLSLVSGTSTAGTYSGGASLPAGTWPVSFEAQATQGPTATLAGPTVVVSAPAPPQPVPAPPAPTPQPPVATPAPTPRPPAPATAAPPQAPQSAPAPAAASAAPAGSTAPAGSSRPGEPVSPDGSSAGAASASPTGAGGSPSPAASSAPGVAIPGTLSTSPSGDEPDGSFPWLLIIGPGAAGAVLLMARRWRGSSADEAIPVPGDAADRNPISLAARARQRQAAGGPHSEDPILAAMGVGAPPPSPARLDAPLSRRVRSGPGERPEPAKSPRRAG